MKKLMLDKSVKFGDRIIKEAEFGGAFVAALRRTTQGQWIARIAPLYAQRHGLDEDVRFLTDTPEEMLDEIQAYVDEHVS